MRNFVINEFSLTYFPTLDQRNQTSYYSSIMEVTQRYTLTTFTGRKLFLYYLFLILFAQMDVVFCSLVKSVLVESLTRQAYNSNL